MFHRIGYGPYQLFLVWLFRFVSFHFHRLSRFGSPTLSHSFVRIFSVYLFNRLLIWFHSIFMRFSWFAFRYFESIFLGTVFHVKPQLEVAHYSIHTKLWLLLLVPRIFFLSVRKFKCAQRLITLLFSTNRKRINRKQMVIGEEAANSKPFWIYFNYTEHSGVQLEIYLNERLIGRCYWNQSLFFLISNWIFNKIPINGPISILDHSINRSFFSAKSFFAIPRCHLKKTHSKFILLRSIDSRSVWNETWRPWRSLKLAFPK